MPIIARIREDGLLWMINRTVFHPRGFALAFDTGTEKFSILGDGTEPWNYDASMNDVEDELFAAFNRLLAKAAAVNGEPDE